MLRELANKCSAVCPHPAKPASGFSRIGRAGGSTRASCCTSRGPIPSRVSPYSSCTATAARCSYRCWSTQPASWGARLAEPGEFSKRAFLNGRLDLAQAEAIADLIAAGSEQAARAALRSLAGEFSERVNELAEALTEARLHVEAAIDFPDEDIDFLADAALEARLEGCRRRFDELAEAASRGRVLKDGYRARARGSSERRQVEPDEPPER